MQPLRPEHTSYEKLPALLQKEAENSWSLIVDAHPQLEELAQDERDWLRWLVAISDFIGWVLRRYGMQAYQVIRIKEPPEYTPLVTQALQNCDNEDNAMAEIRRLRHTQLARLAALDLSGQLSLTDFFTANTALADALIEQSTQWLEKFYRPRWGQALDEQGEILPLVIIAMGKLGGEELNFSSDIDLIFCYPIQGETQGGRQNLEHSIYFTRMGQALIKMLGQQTVDGQAFRVDMRLRPFGQAGPMATSFSALEDYYQEQGRNWERYAMVKARYLNLSEPWREELYNLLRPFVFRRYLDYSAIEALRKMKLLINQEARRRGVSDNIKLGLGGIREVEFIAQAFQLIRGGRERDLQTRSLLPALEACAEHNLLSKGDAAELQQAYACLRKIEHILQQLHDEQTQSLPQEELDQMRLAEACGRPDFVTLIKDLQQQMQNIHRHFLAVIGGEEEMMGEEDSDLAILWQDLLADETAHEVLEEAGVEDAATWWQKINGFRQDVRKRTPGPRGRELLAQLVPVLVELSIRKSGSSDLLARIFSVLQQIASRTTYLELLAHNKGAREQLVLLCKDSPWIAGQLARYPHLLDELIDPAQLYDLPEVDSYKASVHEFMARIPLDDMEAQMETLRQAKQAFQLKIAAADVSKAVHLMRVSDHLTHLAEAVIEQVVIMAWQQLTERHGVPPGRDAHNSGFAVLGYGKLGGMELGYGSDLDLVFVCDDIPDAQTDGQRPIDVQQFYLRLAQRVLHLFTTRTMSGVLYEVDMRLRPSGSGGLLVIQLATYSDYLSREAWTWELQALVRARMVFGHAELRERFLKIREEQLKLVRDEQELRADIVKMRARMREHLWKKHADQLDIKQMPGGVADIEFITQFLVLLHAHEHTHKLCRYTDNVRILNTARQLEILPEQDYHDLVDAYQAYRIESHRLALAERGGLSDQDFSTHINKVKAIWSRMLEPD
ncbi:bifunctional [glutamate--ammonia ligase]-adenylyl-L-tyrosine phosphorylase/[glutamate--ammonia-ligase] adenylyltransferase [Aliidiomarina minuta]|uniref:Bifunctional glutamine synthetase adenylyltransferase/adenylyl-removing enzyme n=1 Tax=Aliidiomarina minuta TaxID=880057 RepID=A0A432W186_9GAMM|nr:bifunctional [glutamate--ammonia ligase]-adenylyl-L-tyrosine phosphorylase/[glutamate--ammonia-ligase] adenylyltransferase [Aliidiomarina minuta]RUO22984.1 bifunctional [glutamate--ammonia ligase]-adenylyl-L-tyrosine phosphorylase/[glutamate--ammonia-ligase] adenylyltransferase [Aliidiomarina minuta]